MKAIKCDICGKTIHIETICMIPRYQIKRRFMPFRIVAIKDDFLGYRNKNPLDVCGRCWNEFKKFVKSKGVM